jgi:hypothetical protein
MISLGITQILLYLSIFIAYLLSTVSTHITMVAIVCMMKDNDDILPFWLEYHSALVGVDNILILDNFSGSNTKTPQILQEWEKKGLKVMWKQGPYSAKGELTTAAYKTFFPKIPIGIPLDIDEFAVGFTNGRPNPTFNAFVDGLVEFIKSREECASLHQYYTVCCNHVRDNIESIDRAIAVNYNTSIAKKMFRVNAITGLDHGNHFVFLAKQGGTCDKRIHSLGLLHYHFRNPRLTIEHALTDLRGFGYIDEKVTPQNARDHLDHFESLVHKQVNAFHKAIEVIRYIKHGYKALLHRCDRFDSVLIGNASTIIRQLPS